MVVTSVIAAVIGPTGTAQAVSPNEYYRTIGQTSHPDWMKWISDQSSLGSVSMPGTHNGLSAHGGVGVETQENYGDRGTMLESQLNAGIRVVDIRVARIDNSFTIHHGAIYQHANFTDVLRVLGSFLVRHPTETVLMNLQSECTGANFSPSKHPNR
jgi:1-phosphatidylinositol phosphodiesterase